MLRPMLASLDDAPLDDPALVYEPKYDGIRAIVDVDAPAEGSRSNQSSPQVRVWSRLGNDKTRQFPEIVAALTRWARGLAQSVVLDGEIVALTPQGQPTGFQQLQGRIHVQEVQRVQEVQEAPPPVAFIAFDLLREGRSDLRERPLVERRAALERLLGRSTGPLLRLSEQASGDGRALYKRALAEGWEGLIAKDAQSRYQSGKRTPEWRKLKIVRVQEFVVGGWTEPRQTRSYFGALLLGVYETKTPRPHRGSGSLIYVGHTGTGFNERELERVMKLLKANETGDCPFSGRPLTNERPHWVRPTLVAEVKFTEWTTDGKLRHPVYLGLRDDKKPEEVIREPDAARRSAAAATTRSLAAKPRSAPSSVEAVPSIVRRPARAAASRGASAHAKAIATKGGVPSQTEIHDLIDQLAALEKSRRDGVLALPGGGGLRVTNLHKIFWPKLRLTKGDLFRYYVRVAPQLLPALADRPLVLKRFPNGIDAEPFYQHRAQDAPDGVRVEALQAAGRRPYIIGGSLKTLLHTTQLAAISQDPWFSRLPAPEFADHTALDLDPPPGVPFGRVLDVARWIRDELEALGVTGAPKTSGSEGLHVYIPLPPRTTYELGLLYCQIIATVVAQKHPKAATTERSVRARGRRIYIDCLQNVLGKTLASAYSARASDYAGVSAPLTWSEIDDGVDRQDFTVKTMPSRVDAAGDLWAVLRESKGADLSRATRYLRHARKGGSRTVG
jgi:bifunctional non-homologous end joining protein LigD